MRTAKWLSVVWMLCALAFIIINVCWAFTPETFRAVMFSEVLLFAPIAGLLLVLYGFNYHALTRNENYFFVKSLFPVVCPNLYIVPFVMVLVSTWGDWHDQEFPRVRLIAAAVELLAVLGISIFGLLRRRPRVYLLALTFIGITATALHIGFLLHDRFVPCRDWGESIGRSIALHAGLVIFALPGLWASLACLLAIFFDASPRKKNVVPARFAERLADATIKDGESGARV